MNKKISTSKKDDSEEPLIDQSSEGLKKLILKGKKKGFLHRAECEKALENEKFDDKEEFYSKVESLNIQIYDEDSEETSNDENERKIKIALEKQKIEEEALKVKLKEQTLRDEARLEKQRTKDIKLFLRKEQAILRIEQAEKQKQFYIFCSLFF